MNEPNNRLEGTKVLSITDANGIQREFVSEVEQEISGFKLKYYMWLSRLFVLFAVASLLLFMSSSLSLFKLAPLVTVEPFLIIQQDSSDGIVRNEPIEYNMASKNQLMETFVRQYVLLRNTVIYDEKEMMTRWYGGGMLNFLSSPRVFSDFEQYRDSVWNKMREDEQVREVEIISIGKLGGERSPVWKVDFKTYDLSAVDRDQKTKAQILTVRYWTASVTAYFVRERVFVGLRLINPLGFTVTRYSQTEVEIF
ncbi:MAG: type IV secretion system protein [Alphaproteobacteria bacterium]